MHVWNANEASEQENAEWQRNSREVVKHNDQGDDSLNSTIDQTLEQTHRDTQIHG